MTASSKVFPGKSNRARTCAARIATGRLSATLKKAALRLRRMMPSSVSLMLSIDLRGRSETVSLPDHARRARTQIVDKAFGGRRSARRDNCTRIDDGRMRTLRKGVDDSHVSLGQRIGRVNDAQWGLAARHQGQRDPNVLGPCDLPLHARPHTEHLQRPFPVFSGRDGVWIGHRELVSTQRGREPKVGFDLERRLAAGGRDQHEAIGEEVAAAAWREKLASVEIVHPLQGCGDEDIRRSAGLDLLRQGTTGPVRDDDGDAGLAFEIPGLLIQRLPEARRGEYGEAGGVPGRGAENQADTGNSYCDRFDPPEHADLATNEFSRTVIYLRI